MFGEVHPRHTNVEKLIEVSSGTAILEQHVGYPLTESNLYFVAPTGEVLWHAERPAPDAHYIRVRLNEDGRSLSAYTTGRHACEIDLKTGKLLNQIEFR